MLELFRNNQLFTTIWVCLLAVPFFWASANWPMGDAEAVAPASMLLAGFLEALGPLWSNLLFVGLALYLAFMVNGFVGRFRLSKRPNFITAVCFILALFALEYSDHLTIVLMVNILLLEAIRNVYQSYEHKNSIVEVFNAGFLTGIAALCYGPACWACLFVLVACLQLRTFHLKEFLVLLTAVLLPFFLMGTYAFVSNQFNSWFYDDLWKAFGRMELDLTMDWKLWIPLGWIAFVLLWTMVNMQQLKRKTTIREQKYLNVLVSFMLLMLLSALGLKAINTQHWAMMLIPFSILLSLNLQSLRNPKAANLLFLLIIISCLLVQFNAFLPI